MRAPPCVWTKALIAVDGVSLTIANVNEEVISVAVIPHTAEHTTLRRDGSVMK